MKCYLLVGCLLKSANWSSKSSSLTVASDEVESEAEERTSSDRLDSYNLVRNEDFSDTDLLHIGRVGKIGCRYVDLLI